MESYISATIAPQKQQLSSIQDFFKSAQDYDLEGMRSACAELGEEATDMLDSILEHSIFSEYISGIEYVQADDSVSIEATCGSSGLEFLIKIIQIVGPYSKNVEGSFSHDEELDEDEEWPLKISYEAGSIKINGRDYENLNDIDEESESYQETEFESVEPKLNETQLIELRNLCQSILTADNDVLSYLAGFEAICKVLIDLEEKYKSGLPMHIDNVEEFHDLAESHGGALKNSSMHPYLCEYLLGVVTKLGQEEYLGTCIKRFDEVLYLTAALFGVLEEDDAKDFLETSIDSQEDFLVWKDYMVMFIQSQMEDED